MNVIQKVSIVVTLQVVSCLFASDASAQRGRGLFGGHCKLGQRIFSRRNACRSGVICDGSQGCSAGCDTGGSDSDAIIAALQAQLGLIQQQLSLIRTGVVEVQSDVGTVQTDVGEVKTGVDEVKTGVDEVKVEVEKIPRDGKGGDGG